jgi:hypothetical protein
MPRPPKSATHNSDTTANLGFEGTATPVSAIVQREDPPPVLSEAKDDMVARPRKLFYITHIRSSLGVIAKNKNTDPKHGYCDSCQQYRITDTRNLGSFINNVHIKLTDDGMKCRFLSRENETSLTLAA